MTHLVGSTQKDPSGLALLGDTHLPEVSDSVGQWPLCSDVCRHPWVMLNLVWERGCQTACSSGRGG